MNLIKWVSIILCAWSFQVKSQSYTVKAGTHYGETFKFTDIYRYPDFRNGTVIFTNGRSSNGLLNYNIFNGEIEFIETTKDTMELINKQQYRSIAIEDDFYRPLEDSYLRLVRDDIGARLWVHEYFKLIDRRKESAYGTTSTSSVNNVRTFVGVNGGVPTGQVMNLVAAEDLVYRRNLEYYIQNEKGQIELALKRNLKKLFPNHHPILKSFIKESKTNFSNEQSLLQLCDFIDGTL